MKYRKVFPLLLIAMLLLASCKSGKTVVRGETEYGIVEDTLAFEYFSSRLRVTLPLQKDDYTLGGTLKIHRDSLIRLSLVTPYIRTEAARIEVSPRQVLVIDRVNKQYAHVPASELRKIFYEAADFHTLQSLLTGRRVEMATSLHGVRWKYANFVSVGNTVFPTRVVMLMDKRGKPRRTTMELSRLSLDEQELKPTKLPARYEQIPLENVLEMLERL